MKISRAEQKAIRLVVAAGEVHGFGNMISHLQTRWAQMLMTDHGFDEKTSRTASGGTGYPFEMQADLMERGQWDETGKRYRKAPKESLPCSE